MVGKYSFSVCSKKVEFQITLKRNVTVIRGDGGSGKTTLCEMINNSKKTGSGVHLKSYKLQVRVLDADSFNDGLMLMHKNEDIVFVIDEDESFIKSSEFAEQVQLTGCYVLLITRENLKCLPCSIHEIYQIESQEDLISNRVIKTMQQLYPEDIYGRLNHADAIVTEDLRAGKQFFSRTCNTCAVIPAKSKDNILNLLTTLTDTNVVVVVDGAAFGFVIQDLLKYISGRSVMLYTFESFEYVLLKSGIVDSLIPADLNIDNPPVDSQLYLTWERYYTQLLERITQGTVYEYSKEQLAKVYTQPQNADRVYSVFENMPVNKSLFDF